LRACTRVSPPRTWQWCSRVGVCAALADTRGFCSACLLVGDVCSAVLFVIIIPGCPLPVTIAFATQEACDDLLAVPCTWYMRPSGRSLPDSDPHRGLGVTAARRPAAALTRRPPRGRPETGHPRPPTAPAGGGRPGTTPPASPGGGTPARLASPPRPARARGESHAQTAIPAARPPRNARTGRPRRRRRRGSRPRRHQRRRRRRHPRTAGPAPPTPARSVRAAGATPPPRRGAPGFQCAAAVRGADTWTSVTRKGVAGAHRRRETRGWV